MTYQDFGSDPYRNLLGLVEDSDGDSPLTEHEALCVAALCEHELQAIDELVLAHVRPRQLKVARIVGDVMTALNKKTGPHAPVLPDVFFASRVALLVQRGALDSFGDLSRMKFSEVCLPGGKATTPIEL